MRGRSGSGSGSGRVTGSVGRRLMLMSSIMLSWLSADSCCPLEYVSWLSPSLCLLSTFGAQEKWQKLERTKKLVICGGRSVCDWVAGPRTCVSCQSASVLSLCYNIIYLAAQTTDSSHSRFYLNLC